MSSEETAPLEKTDFQSQLADRHKSALGKYVDIAVGRRGLMPFLSYELACWFLAPAPGALGYFLRSQVYRQMLGFCGRGLIMGRNVTLRHPRRIRLGQGVVIDDNCVLDAKGYSADGICIGDGVAVARNTILSCKGGSIDIEDNANMGANCVLISESRLSIGKNVLIAGMTYIIAGGNHGIERTDVPIIAQPMTHKGGIIIGENCWLGANVTVLDGVTIGRDTVVGAGAVVIDSLPEFSIAVGAPARVIKMRK